MTVGFRWGGLSLSTVTPRTGDNAWAEKAQDLDNPELELDGEKAKVAHDQLGDVKELLSTIDEHFNDLDAEHKAEHVIKPEDGI